MVEELEIIASCFDKQFKNYQQKLTKINFRLDEYYILVGDYKVVIPKLLKSYVDECHKFPSALELKIYEKAACLAMAIKNNHYFIVTDQFGFLNYTYINSLFAIDMALNFCEHSLPFNYRNNLEQLKLSSEIQYTRGLLADILEHKNVTAKDISNNIKQEVDLFISLLQSKVNKKSK